jgi:tRNA 2-selenouridine synthase
MKYIESREFLEKAVNMPVIDVRSPGEYRQGHIPGAHNIPLFSDAERKDIGTIYKKQGRKESVKKGLLYTGPKMLDFIEKAEPLAVNGKLLLHCWRGGMRSESMGWLFETVGLKCELLKGGYKAYRKHIRENIFRDKEILVLGGLTGSGKTKILLELKKRGEPVIDLEGMARHKGSAFGGIGQGDQPTSEQFENQLFSEVARINDTYFWVEDESLRIGRVFIPEPFYRKMTASKLLFIKVPDDYRHSILLEDYSESDKGMLIGAIEKIRPRLGGLDASRAIEAVSSGNYLETVKILLKYYDKTYLYSLDKRKAENIIYLDLSGLQPEQYPELVIRQKSALMKKNI